MPDIVEPPEYPQIGSQSFEDWLCDAGYTDNDFPYGRFDSKYEDLYASYKEEQEEYL